MSRWFWRVGVTFGLALSIAACSAAKRTNYSTNASAEKVDAGSPDAPLAFEDDDASRSAGCSPSEGQYDIPGNGCDDDGDGEVDNTPECDQGLQTTGGADDFAKALGLCRTSTGPDDPRWGLIVATYARGYKQNAAPAPGQHGILKKFGAVVKPREGNALGVLSTGWAREYNGDSGNSDFKQSPEMTGQGALPPGFPKAASGCDISDEVHDVASIKLVIKVPDNAKGIAFDFNFHSAEWPEFVCSEYNDGFIAFLQSEAMPSGKPDNISFDAQGNPVSVNNGFFDRCTPQTETGCAGAGLQIATCPGGEAELEGTGFAERGEYCGKTSTAGGATGWLTSQAEVKPGEVISIELMIWDTGDSAYDSSVLLDHITWLPAAVETKTERPR